MITRDDCATFGFPHVEVRYSITSDSMMRVSEVCSHLHVERHTVYKWIDCGLLPGRRIQGRVTLIPKEAVEKLLNDY